MSVFRARRIEAQLAFALLTRLPCGRLPDDVPPTSAAAWAFPLVGAFLGALTGAAYLIAATLLPALPAALVAIAFGVMLTGALHEDGLADVADGFGGGTSREIKLAIMRDSQVGSYGAFALITTLGFLATTIATAPPTGTTWALFITIGAISRAAMVIPMSVLPTARADGLGYAAALAPGWRGALSLAVALAAALITYPTLILAAAFSTAAITWLAKRQIGGQTGDVLGATQKLAECAAWGLAAAYISAS